MPNDPRATAVLEPLAEDRARIERIVTRLDVTDDLTERADLAAELSRSVSRYESAVEQVLEAHPPGDDATLADLARNRQAMRQPLTVIHERTMHIDPRNVHVGDPEGFEEAIAQALDALVPHLTAEDACLRRLVDGASPEARQALAGAVRKAARTASERPHPPRTGLGRVLSNLHVKLDHALEDVSNPLHPGSDTIEER